MRLLYKNLRLNIEYVTLAISVDYVPSMRNLCDEFEKVIEYEVLILMPITLTDQILHPLGAMVQENYLTMAEKN